jgi:hypothetical protein
VNSLHLYFHVRIGAGQGSALYDVVEDMSMFTLFKNTHGKTSFILSLWLCLILELSSGL